MTTILFAGGEVGAFQPSSNAAGEQTFGGSYDPNYARCSLLPGGATAGAGEYLLSGSWAAQAAGIWLHWMQYYVHSTIYSGTDHCISFYDNTDTEQFYVAMKGTVNLVSDIMSISLFYSDNVQVGQTISIPGLNLTQLDLHITPTAATLYVGGGQRTTGLKAMANVANITHFRLRQSPYTPYYSELIVADQPTVSMRLQTLPITANGDIQDWTGNYTDINEIVYDDGHFISTTVANDVSTYAQATTLQSDNILAIVVTARAVTNGLAPQNLELAIELGAGTSPYFSPSFLQGVGYQGNYYVWNVNPNGNVPWTRNVVQVMLYGVKSIA